MQEHMHQAASKWIQLFAEDLIWCVGLNDSLKEGGEL
jgi:hypothetical protein